MPESLFNIFPNSAVGLIKSITKQILHLSIPGVRRCLLISVRVSVLVIDMNGSGLQSICRNKS